MHWAQLSGRVLDDMGRAKRRKVVVGNKFEFMLKTYLTNNGLLVALAFVFLIAGIAISIICKDFQWLSRFGALVICVGVITLARPSIVGEDIKIHVIAKETGFSYLDPEHWKILGEPMPEYVKQDLRSRTAVGWLGPLMCFIGTVTNGFGDLIIS
jgi:hypothetical protein